MLKGGTIGVFDLLHVGHLDFLQAARAQCDYLKVGIGEDELVTRSKGKRPVIEQAQRKELVSALVCVDETCLFDVGLDNTEATLAWVHAWGINTMFVSSDWRQTPRWQRLAPALAAQGIACIWLPYRADISTSMIRGRVLTLGPDST